MSRVARLLLALSLALNLGFAAAWWHSHERPSRPAWDRPGRPGPGDGGWHRGGPGRPGGDWVRRRAGWLDRTLRLDPAQRAALDDSLRPLEPELRAARRGLWAARRAFREEMMRPEVDRSEALRRSAEVSRWQARLDSLTTEALVREAHVLGPEMRRRPGKWIPRPPRR